MYMYSTCITHFHHDEFLGVGEVALGRFVAKYLGADVDVRAIDEALLYVLQHLSAHVLERRQVFG